MTTRSLSYTPSAHAPTGGTPTGDLTADAGAPPDLPVTGEVMRRASGENFKVASRLLPRRVRSELLGLYGYARLVDEIGDSYDGDRIAALDSVESSLLREIESPDPAAHPLVARAAAMVRDGRISRQPLLNLIEANRLDQTVHRYETAEELYGYCALSANPVGRLVLQLFGVLTPERVAWSDSICTGLQLVEHWQDVAEDAAGGRVYLPAEDMSRFGVADAELAACGPARADLRSLMAFEARRARGLLEEGAPLVASLRGRLRFAVAGFVAGGHAALDALARQGFDPLAGAPRPSRPAVLRHLGNALMRRREHS